LKLYIDLDGVLADFDKAANEVLKTDNHHEFTFKWGNEETWKRLHADGQFFAKLPLMPDAIQLWNAVKHLKPTVLTALPKSDSDRVDTQKREWVRKYFYGAPVITCMTVEKPRHCAPGDILIDDRAVNLDAWKAKGGTYIIHYNSETTIGALRALGII
jgi:5'(3')-deoxyribonucleotidase